MGAEIIDGKAFAAGLRARVAAQVAALQGGARRHARPRGRARRRGPGQPGLRPQQGAADASRPACTPRSTGSPPATAEAELLALVDRLNARPARSTASSCSCRCRRTSTPTACSTPSSRQGRRRLPRRQRRPPRHRPRRRLVPCTPLGCLMLLRDRLGDLAGLEAVVVGRSNIVGKPMAQLLLARQLHGHHRALAHPRPAGRLPPRRHPRRRGRAAGDGHGRLDQARRDGDRRRHQPRRRAGRQDPPRRRRRLRRGRRASPARSPRCPAASAR